MVKHFYEQKLWKFSSQHLARGNLFTGPTICVRLDFSTCMSYSYKRAYLREYPDPVIVLRSISPGRPYPVKDPVNPLTPTPPVLSWHWGTRQHWGSLGSATNVQVEGTLSYLGHLQHEKEYHSLKSSIFIRKNLSKLWFPQKCT